MNRDARSLALLAARAAHRAAQFIRAAARPPAAEWTAKGHHDFVTAVDEGAEDRIRETLLRAEPGSRVLGEERTPDAIAMAGLVWVVDPLDGTANFLHGHPGHAVSIGAVVDGVPVAGAIDHIPALRRYVAWQDGGAWCGDQRLQVSPIAEPAHALIGTGFPFKNPELLPPYMPILARVLAATSGVRRGGSAALDLVDVALGRFDAFWEMRLAPWDIAAGLVLVREAGGVVWDFDRRDAPVDHGPVLAGNRVMAEWLLKMVSGEG